MKWKDNKKISHNGRIYRSSEDFIKEIDIPSEITQNDVDFKFDENFVIVSIQKPKKEIVENKNSEPIVREDDNMLMKLKVPKQGDDHLEFSIENGNLTVKYCNVLKKYASDNKTVVSSSQTKIQRSIPLREGITADDIGHMIEDGELQVFLKAKPENVFGENTEENEIANLIEQKEEIKDECPESCLLSQ